MARARLLRGSFDARTKVYRPGDTIPDIERIPEDFRDQWEILPERSKRKAVVKPVEKKKTAVKRNPTRRESAKKESQPKKKNETVSK